VLWLLPPLPLPTLFPYTTLFRSVSVQALRAIRSGCNSILPLLSNASVQDHRHCRWNCGSGGNLSSSNRGPVLGLIWPKVGKRKRSEEHTSELQSRFDIVCCLLLE